MTAEGCLIVAEVSPTAYLPTVQPYPSSMSVNPPSVQFGPEGQPVYILHEWHPGVDVVQHTYSADGAPLLAPVQELGPGVKPVYVTNNFDIDERVRAREHEAAAWAAANDRLSTSTGAGVSDPLLHLLLG